MSWRARANCLGQQTDIFFNADGRNETYMSLREVRQICEACPVKTACLKDAIDTGEMFYGIRGGLLPVERRRLKEQSA